MHPETSGGLIHVAIKAETLFTIGPLEVTNSMVGALLASAILLVDGVGLRPPAGDGSQPAAEPDRVADRVARRYRRELNQPLARLRGRWSSGCLLMILVANWLGLLPGVGTIGVRATARSSSRSCGRHRPT